MDILSLYIVAMLSTTTPQVALEPPRVVIQKDGKVVIRHAKRKFKDRHPRLVKIGKMTFKVWEVGLRMGSEISQIIYVMGK